MGIVEQSLGLDSSRSCGNLVAGVGRSLTPNQKDRPPFYLVSDDDSSFAKLIRVRVVIRAIASR